MLRSGESNRAPSASRELHLTLTSFPVRVCLLNEAEINFAHERSWKEEEEERRGGHGTTQLHHQASLLQPISFPHRRSRRRPQSCSAAASASESESRIVEDSAPLHCFDVLTEERVLLLLQYAAKAILSSLYARTGKGRKQLDFLNTHLA